MKHAQKQIFSSSLMNNLIIDERGPATSTSEKLNKMYWLTGFLGAMLLSAPSLFHYMDNNVALLTSVVVGSIIILASLSEWVENGTDDMEYWVIVCAGISIFFAPFILGFSEHLSAKWTSIFLGAIIAVVGSAKVVVDHLHKHRLYW